MAALCADQLGCRWWPARQWGARCPLGRTGRTAQVGNWQPGKSEGDQTKSLKCSSIVKRSRGECIQLSGCQIHCSPNGFSLTNEASSFVRSILTPSVSFPFDSHLKSTDALKIHHRCKSNYVVLHFRASAIEPFEGQLTVVACRNFLLRSLISQNEFLFSWIWQISEAIVWQSKRQMQGFGHLAVGRNALPVGNTHPPPSSSPHSVHLANSQVNVTPPSANLIVKPINFYHCQVTPNPHKAWTQLHLIINSGEHL